MSKKFKHEIVEREGYSAFKVIYDVVNKYVGRKSTSANERRLRQMEKGQLKFHNRDSGGLI